MQARAIFEAAAEVQAKALRVSRRNYDPLVGFPRELKLQIDIVRRCGRDRGNERGATFKY